jgi:hypothetical protein
MLLLIMCIGFVWFVREECIFSNGEVGMLSFVGPCRPCIPCNSQDDFHHKGHFGHHLIFLFGRISVWDGNNFWCAHIFDSLHIEQYIFCVWAVQIVFCSVVYILWWICPCYSGQVLVPKKSMESGSLVLYCLIFQIFVTVHHSFSISILISSRLME